MQNQIARKICSVPKPNLACLRRGQPLPKQEGSICTPYLRCCHLAWARSRLAADTAVLHTCCCFALVAREFLGGRALTANLIAHFEAFVINIGLYNFVGSCGRGE
jgi:hypothetical protein